MTPAIDPAKVEEQRGPHATAATLRIWIRANRKTGGDCKILSKGADCDCPLCLADDLLGMAMDAQVTLDSARRRIEELTEAATDVLKSIENYTSENKPESEWDEYDYMMIPKWKRLRAALAPPQEREAAK